MELNARLVEHIPSISGCANTKPATYVTGKINGFNAKTLLDSGASCSVVCSEYITLKDVKPLGLTTLSNADGTELSVKGITTAPVILNGLNTPHSFIVVDNLSAPVILGCDFLFKHMHGMTLDFGKGTFHCNHHSAKPEKFESQKKFLNMLVLDDDIPQAVPCSMKNNQ